MSGLYVSRENMGRCGRCKEYTDLRLGFCFDCATSAEKRAAQRSVAQHVVTGVGFLGRRRWTNARICFAWAWERLSRTGDYAPGGEFEREYGIRK